MSSVDPTVLLEALEEAWMQNLCPNRVWQACLQIADWEYKKLILEKILGGMFPKEAMQHEDHVACSIDYCEFSSRNFTMVQQYHEPRSFETSEQTKGNHKEKGVCFALRNLFDDAKLVEAVNSHKSTAWGFDGYTLLEHRPFMAISHVWSDGTSSGDSAARSKALGAVHHNYAYARVTLVHDRFLRNVPFGGPDDACIVIVLSSWFTRGWTALELAKSRRVEIAFKDSVQNIDKNILDRAQRGNFAAKLSRDLRKDQFSDMEDLFAALGPRYTSWTKDRAIIAGLLAGVQISHTARDIYQNILKKLVCYKFVSITSCNNATKPENQQRWGSMRLILQIGIYKWVEDEDSQTPLWWAVAAGHDDIARAFIEDTDMAVKNMLLTQAMEDIPRIDLQKLFRLSIAQGGDRREHLVQALINADADVNAVNGRGETPLYIAARQRSASKIVKKLLHAGANALAEDELGYTPLSNAIGCRNNEMIEAMLTAGASLEATNKNGETPALKAQARFNGWSFVQMSREELESAYKKLNIPKRKY
ncbi:hypothetical protein F4680DRAFT_452451 [Xylaria scruposa]|nr:hypothetical protein F4680DRAFT_452451 [Xylaria scruposa]